MRKTRVVAVTSLIAASAMVLAACGSSPGQATGTGSGASDTSQSQSSSADTGATGTGTSGTDTSAASPAAGVGEVGGSACGTPHGPYDDPGAPSGSVSVGYNQLAESLNEDSGHGNSTYNANVLYLMNGPGLYYYNDKNELINNDSFGTCTLDSLDPLTVTYKINPDAKWSDGVPVTGADILMQWIAESGFYNTEEVEYDDNGNVKAGSGIAFDAASPAAALVTDFPKLSDDGKSVTFTYSKFYVDYDVAFGVGVPAHVVAMNALKESDAAKATSDMVALFQQNLKDVKAASDADKAKMKAVADFWNSGFDTTQMPSNASVLVSHGAYKLTDWKKDQYMTFTANPDFNWGPKPSVQTIVWTYAPDPTAAVQSLQNGDLDIINPQATTDVKAGLDKLKDSGIDTVAIDGATYEHVDLVFDNKGPFDPATYGGDAAKALKVRQAFLLTIPRQQIVKTLITPLNPNAVLRQSFTMFPGQPGYDDMVKENGSDFYADAGSDANVAKAKDLLKEAGVSTPVKVRLMYADNNPRRAQEYQLIAASAAKAGFQVVDGKNAKWASQLGNTAIYDASLFAWQSESTAVGESAANYLCKTGDVKEWGQNNFGHYCNADVNAAFTDLNSQPDTKKQFDDLLAAEKLLWADAFGSVLFQYPDIVGYNSSAVSGVSDAPLSPTFLWNFWEWKLAS